jgi:survival-of-motor-neuron-related-splicing factor 30
METELQTYKDQLAYVNLSLEADPANQELLALKSELDELISLTRTALAPSSSKGTSTSTDKGKGKAKEANSNWQDVGPYKAGMDCMAKYKDGKL